MSMVHQKKKDKCVSKCPYEKLDLKLWNSENSLTSFCADETHHIATGFKVSRKQNTM